MAEGNELLAVACYIWEWFPGDAWDNSSVQSLLGASIFSHLCVSGWKTNICCCSECAGSLSGERIGCEMTCAHYWSCLCNKNIFYKRLFSARLIYK